MKFFDFLVDGYLDWVGGSGSGLGGVKDAVGYGERVMGMDPYAYLRLDRVVDGKVLDISGAGRDGVLVGNGVEVDDRPLAYSEGRTLGMDGVGVSFEVSTDLNPVLDDVSVFLWVKPGGGAGGLPGSANMNLVQQQDGSGLGRTWMVIRQGTSGLYNFQGGGSRESGYTVLAGVWQFLGLSWSVSEQRLRWYVNGALAATADYAAGSANGDLVFGANKSKSGQFYAGRMAEVCLFDRVVGDDEVLGLWSGALGVLE